MTEDVAKAELPCIVGGSVDWTAWPSLGQRRFPGPGTANLVLKETSMYENVHENMNSRDWKLIVKTGNNLVSNNGGMKKYMGINE